MASKGTLTVKIVGDDTKFRQTMDGVQGKLSGFGSKAATAGKAAAVGIGAVATGAALLGQEVLNTGAKLTAWRQKTSTVFEGQARDVRKWADANNEAFGLTDDELAGLAASFGDLLKPMGFTAKEAATMSKDVVGLSGALSEWSGGQRSAAEVAEILSSAMLGEREQLKELGISITEADVQARLAAKGQKELTGAALEQAKAIATQELIFAKSTDAQKAYAAGGNEALRAQNELKAGIAELREQLADRLLPIVTAVTQWMADNLPAAMDRAGQIAADLKARWDEVFPALKAAWEAFASATTTALDAVSAAFTVTFEVISAVVSVFVETFSALWATFGETITKYATETWKNIQGVISAALDVIRGIFDTFAGLFTGDWSRMWDGIKQVLSGVWESMKASVSQALDTIRAAISGSLDAIAAAWSGAWNGLKDGLWLVWEGIKGIVSGSIDAVVGFVASLPGRIGGAAVGAFDGLWEAFKSAINRIINGWNNLQLGPWTLPRVEVDLGPIGSYGFGGQTIGPWSTPNIPTLHTGGTFRADRPGGVGLALLRDGEIHTPTEPGGGGGMPDMDYWRDAGREQARAYAAEMRRLGRAG